MNKYEQLKLKIAEAVGKEKKIYGLADVLLVINKKYLRKDLEIDINWADGVLVFSTETKEAWWKLKKDFDNQSKECKLFLKDLLL